MQIAVTIDPTYPLGFVGLGTEQFALAVATSTHINADQRAGLVAASFKSLHTANLLNPKQSAATLQLGLELIAVNQVEVGLQVLDEARQSVPDDITLNSSDKQRIAAVINAAINAAKKSRSNTTARPTADAGITGSL